MSRDDPWQVLDLPKDASDEQIRARYVALVKQHPPQKDPEAFASISDAYMAVKGPRERAQWDLFGPEPLQDIAELVELLIRSKRRTIPVEEWIQSLREEGKADEGR